MPELRWAWGYPAAIVAMVLLAVVLWAVFKRRHWL
jgi:magnesium transporter